MKLDWPSLKVELVDTNTLTPNPRNPRKHSTKQVKQIAAAIKEWGFTTSILVDENNTIIAGHGRHKAAEKLKLEKVPIMRAIDWSDTKKMAYLLADNKLGLNSEWDEQALKTELEFLESEGFDIELAGFDDFDLENDFSDIEEDLNAPPENYTRKIKIPHYEITGKKPKLSDLYNHDKTLTLKLRIEQSNIDEEIKDFLLLAAERHTIFNFKNIAEYYAHSKKEVQEFFEESGLVIIDFNDAIKNGFVKMTSELLKYSEAEQDGE